jgi:hypothetical protein
MRPDHISSRSQGLNPTRNCGAKRLRIPQRQRVARSRQRIRRPFGQQTPVRGRKLFVPRNDPE